MRQRIVVLFVMLVALTACRAGAGSEARPEATPTPSAAVQALELLAEGKSLLEADECQAALEPLKQATELDPVARRGVPDPGERLCAYRGGRFGDRGLWPGAQGRPGLCGRLYQPWRRLSPSDRRPEAVKAAIGAFRDGIELEPEDAETHANLGSAFLQVSQVPEAKEELEEAIDSIPDWQRRTFHWDTFTCCWATWRAG